MLLQQESCDEMPKMPLEIIGAQTQGQIGYMIESSLDTALMEIGILNKVPLAEMEQYVQEVIFRPGPWAPRWRR